MLERTIPLPGVSGRIDRMAVDPQRGRLFVAEHRQMLPSVEGVFGPKAPDMRAAAVAQPRGTTG